MRSQLADPDPNVLIVVTSPSGTMNRLCRATKLWLEELEKELEELENEELQDDEELELLNEEDELENDDELLEQELELENEELELLKDDELENEDDELELELENEELEHELENDDEELENEDEDEDEELENEELELEKDDEQDEELELELEQTKNSILVIWPTGASMSEIRLISKLFDQSILTAGLVPLPTGISTVAIVLRAGIDCCSLTVQVEP